MVVRPPAIVEQLPTLPAPFSSKIAGFFTLPETAASGPTGGK